MLKCSLCQRSLEDKLLQTLLQSLPGSSGNGGSSRIQALLKVSGKVGIKSSDFWFCHILPTLQWLMLPCSAQWKSSHFFCFIFISSPGYNVKQACFGLWAASKLSVSCHGCAVPVSWSWRRNWNNLLGWYHCTPTQTTSLFWCWQEQWTTVNWW